MFFYFILILGVSLISWGLGSGFWEYIHNDKNYKAILCVVLNIIICVLLSWLFAYDQQNTIKKCYYNGVSVKVDTLSIDCNGVGKHIEPDSTFYINKMRE